MMNTISKITFLQQLTEKTALNSVDIYCTLHIYESSTYCTIRV